MMKDAAVNRLAEIRFKKVWKISIKSAIVEVRDFPALINPPHAVL